MLGHPTRESAFNENLKDELDLLPTDKRQRFLEIAIIAFTQNNKFAICSQYLKKELSVEVDFLHADKLATNWYYDFDGDGQAFPKVPKERVCNVFTIS